jgi:hypothetical protein
MQIFEQLQAENLELKTDLKTIKTVIIDITNQLGVTTNGVMNEDVELSDIVSNILPDLTKIATGGLIGKAKKIVGITSTSKPNTLLEKFGSVKLVFPLVEKYKTL